MASFFVADTIPTPSSPGCSTIIMNGYFFFVSLQPYINPTSYTMEGFILAAGLGTRLRPLTDDRPKALVEIGGRPLLEHCIERLVSAGVTHIVVNVHHFADKVEAFLRSRRWPCDISISDERELLLDTGGALAHAMPLFTLKEDIVVHNVDILSDVSLAALAAHHRRQRNLATLCVSRRSTRRMLLFDRHGRLVGRASEEPVPAPLTTLAFSGITLVDPALLPLLPAGDHAYPIIDQYIALSQQGCPIGSFLHDARRWLDVGKPETLKQAEQWIASSER